MWQQLPPWILERIFEWSRYNKDKASGNNQLSRLLCVCKPWSEVALNLLWAKCKDLSYLLPTLPADILHTNGETGALVDHTCWHRAALTEQFKEFSREATAKDLERFNFYSLRIQQLTYHHQLPGTLYSLDLSVLLHLYTSLTTPFPNLQRLFFASGNTEGWKALQCLASPQLSQLVLDFRLDFRSGLAGEHVQKHVSAAHDACSNVFKLLGVSLRTLVAKMNKENEASLAPIFADLIQHLPMIRKLQVPLGGPAFSPAFHQLCQMTYLVVADLKVHIESFEEVERLHETIAPNPFKSLRTLYLESSISFYQPIIRTIQSTTLNSLRLVFRERCPLPTESFNSLIQATCSATSSLQVFELTIHTPSSRRLQSNLPTAAALLPLFAHRKLQELVIDLGVPIQLTDADVDTIACMWPRLWRLRLIATAGAGSGFIGNDEGWKPRATCRAIAALFYHLRHLTELAIEFDARTLDELGDRNTPARNDFAQLMGDGLTESNEKRVKTPVLQICGLRQFDAGHSIPGIPLAVAAWFAVLCPKLRELRWAGENEGWERTSAVLHKIQDRKAL